MTAWPRSLAAHVETWRPYTSCYVGLVGLAGASLATERHDAVRMAAAWAVPTVGWLAGLYGGDYFDRELDAVAKPQRPIPSGRLSARTALGCMIALVAIGAVGALAVNWHAIALVALALVLGISYNAYFKARGLAGNIVRGALTSFAFCFGVLATGDHLTVRLAGLSAVFWLHDAGSNLVGTLRDVEGDAAGGYRTLPVRIGIGRTVRVISVLVIGWSALAVAGPLFVPREPGPAFAALLTAAIAAGYAVVGLLIRAGAGLTRAFALSLHEVICVERVVLAGALVAWGAGGVPAAAVTLPAAAVTYWAQRTLRAKHEFDPAADGGWTMANLQEGQ